MLSTQNLSFHYEQGDDILTDINLTLSKGRVTGLIGANGSGKSTLFMNLLGIVRPQHGAVCWNGEPIRYHKKALYQLRQSVSVVFQDPDLQVFYTDIRKDIAFSLHNLGTNEADIHQRVESALQLVDAQHFADQPMHYLSLGQKKRVAIAGALVLNSPCILLDEPTAGLDPLGREHTIKIIQRIVAEGRHVLISSHDIDLIYQVCHDVYVLHKGHILTYGNTQSVFLQTELIKQAGLVQPWLVKLHLHKGYPLYPSEEAFFADHYHHELARDISAKERVI